MKFHRFRSEGEGRIKFLPSLFISFCAQHDDLLEMVRRAMIEHFVRALLAGELSSFVTTCGTEHAQTASARQLHCRRPDPSARAVHQYSFARLSVATLEQPTIRSRVRRADGCALRERNICRQRMHLLCRAECKLGVCPAD